MTPRHEQQWEQWFSEVYLKIEDIPPLNLPMLQFPTSRTPVAIVSTHTPRHSEKWLTVAEQPLQWKGHEYRVGNLQVRCPILI
jgi:hypothetical protein